MTDQEKFEQWWGNPRESLTSDMTQEQKVNTWVWEAWQTAKQDSAAEIKTLREIKIEQECHMKEMRADSAAEIAELKTLRNNAATYLLKILIQKTQLQDENLKLREALEKLANLGSGISPHYGNSQGNMIARQVLASIPAQSLQAHDDEPVGTTYVSSSGYMEVELHRTVDAGAALYTSTKVQSLQAHDDELIEQCAVVCDKLYAKNVGNAIRELKGKP